jgi:hypothetical protein
MKKYLASLLFVLFSAAFLAPKPASATILWAGGEDNDMTCFGNCVVNNTGFDWTHDGNYSRISLVERKDWAVGLPMGNYWSSPTFTAGSTLWIHASMGLDNSCCTTDYILAVLSPDGVIRIAVRNLGSDHSRFIISKRNAAGTLTDLVTQAMSPFGTGNWRNNLDLYINYAVAGQVTLYNNGVPVATYSGDVTTDGATQLNQFQLGGYYIYWSEVIAATTNTCALRLYTLPGVANGVTDTWTNGGVSNVNETVLSDATLNSSNTSAQIQLYTVPALPTGTFSIPAVQINMRAAVDTTGPQHIYGLVHTASDGLNHNSAALAPPQGAYGQVSAQWTTNPATAVAWTMGDLGAGAFNMGFESQP